VRPNAGESAAALQRAAVVVEAPGLLELLTHRKMLVSGEVLRIDQRAEQVRRSWCSKRAPGFC